jgi:hypothetical protein
MFRDLRSLCVFVALAAGVVGCSGAQRRAPTDVSLEIQETLDGKALSTVYASTVWSQALADGGHVVVGADTAPLRLNVVSEANRVDTPPEYPGFVTYRARVSGRLTRVSDARVLATGSAEAGGLDLDARLAAAKAIESAAKVAAGNLSAAERKTVPQGAPAPNEQLTYDDGRGSIAMPGGLDSRPKLLKRIGEICSSKNVGLRAGQESTQGGVYKVDAEKLESGRFRIDFACIY